MNNFMEIPHSQIKGCYIIIFGKTIFIRAVSIGNLGVPLTPEEILDCLVDGFVVNYPAGAN